MTKLAKISRRSFLGMALAAIPGISAAHLVDMEPEQLKMKKLFLDGMNIKNRIIHFSDLHFRGDSLLTEKTIELFRVQKPDFACFTGDLIDSQEYAEGAFRFIQSLGCPVYGVPGNHDYWSGVSFQNYRQAFRKTGGDWLENSSVVTEDGSIEMIGTATSTAVHAVNKPQADQRILLSHYPLVADLYQKRPFSLVLAGHSHGGQIRVPLYGPVYLPDGVGRYDLGTFETTAGIMHVSAGLGTSILPIRFNCHPEITLITT